MEEHGTNACKSLFGIGVGQERKVGRESIYPELSGWKIQSTQSSLPDLTQAYLLVYYLAPFALHLFVSCVF